MLGRLGGFSGGGIDWPAGLRIECLRDWLASLRVDGCPVFGSKTPGKTLGLGLWVCLEHSVGYSLAVSGSIGRAL